MTQSSQVFEEYPSAPAEDGSAPRPVRAERVRSTTVWHDVACGRCRAALTPVFPETVGEDGGWDHLQAADALQVSLSGGYGMYVDPLGSRGEHAQVLLCKECAQWLRSEVPGIDLVLRRLEQS